jgi:hypothetical protein
MWLAAIAQTYPPSDGPSLIPPTSGSLAPTGADGISLIALVVVVLLAAGITALLVARARMR